MTHSEAISFSDFLTGSLPDGTLRYRPTAHYAYRPCDDAIISLCEYADKEFVESASHAGKRVVIVEIEEGYEKLGVFGT